MKYLLYQKVPFKEKHFFLKVSVKKLFKKKYLLIKSIFYKKSIF